jgi:hypothetical protein
MLSHSPELLILSTAYCLSRAGAAPYFELVAAADRDVCIPREIILTRSETIYQAALAIEGTDARIRIPYAAAFSWRRVIARPTPAATTTGRRP